MEILVDVLKSKQTFCIKIIGEIDALTAPVLKERLSSTQEMEELVVELDLTDVEYVDSTGLGVFVGFYKSMKLKGGHVKFTGLSSRVKRLFDITGLSEIMDIEMVEKGE